MTTYSSARLPLLLVPLALLVAGAAQAAAGDARLDLSTVQAAEGGYVLADGRELSLRLLSRAVEVRVDDQPAQRWLPQSEAVLVSPDGRHRLHLHRGTNGFVDRVSLESPRPR